MNGKPASQTLWHVKQSEGLDDYEGVLTHGMILDGHGDGPLEYGRVGPFMPPSVRAGGIILVRQSLKEELESTGLTGLGFREVRVTRAVRIDWRNWQRRRSPSEILGECDDEPEDYVLHGRNDAALIQELGPIWELAAARFDATRDHPRTNFSSPSPTAHRYALLVDEAARTFVHERFGEAVTTRLLER